ncbi:MAG: exonuclease domain-containing protein [Pseudomonadota bacterium]
MKLSALSLRLRILLFFAFLALGGIAAVSGALWVGHARMADSSPQDGFIFAAVLAGFLLLALNAGVWLLFDENVAKPIERLAASMRARTHAQIDAEIDAKSSQYLGDLAPAANAMTRKLGDSASQTAHSIATETARLNTEKARLTALLSEIPVATIMVGAGDRIVLYDGQAADLLGRIQTPRLHACLFDYFEAEAVETALAALQGDCGEVDAQLYSSGARHPYPARIRRLPEGYMIIIDATALHLDPAGSRPLVYDFELTTAAVAQRVEEMPLSALTYAVIDTETTGLSPRTDQIVQIGAVRVVGGRIVPGEELDLLVNPGRMIPEASTRVHGIDDAMVADHPGIEVAATGLHQFCKDAVIVAHNAPFDLAFLHKSAPACGVCWDHPILDTVLLSAVVFGASETHTLDALCDRLGIGIPESQRHTALGDARVTADALVSLLKIAEARGFETFKDLNAEMKRHTQLIKAQADTGIAAANGGGRP